MKIFFLALTLFICCDLSAQTKPSINYEVPYYYEDEEGNRISEDRYREIRKDRSKNVYSWSTIGRDTVVIRKLVNVGEERKQISYPAFVKKLEQITGRKFPENPVIILNYNYLNDLCNLRNTINEWNRFRIRSHKRYFNDLEKIAEEHYENVIILHFFEEGITIKPSDILKKYFHIDKGNFLRNTLFTTPIICGSSAVVMPGGRTLLKHSEGSSKLISQVLAPEKWQEIFEAE